MATHDEVRAQARRLQGTGEWLHALRLWDAIVAASPTSYEARTKVADCLAALGEPDNAANVYRAVAWYCIKAGHPLPAIVIAKILESMGAEFDDLCAALVAYYGNESEMTGPLGARVSPPEADLQMAAPDLRVADPKAIEAATERGRTCTDEFGGYPEALLEIPLLSELSEGAFRKVLATLVAGRLPGGAVVIRQGEPGSSFFFVASGEVAISMVEAGTRRDIASLHENSVFGEMSLLSARPRSASAEVVGEADLIEFTRDALTAIAGEVSQLAQALHRFTQERLLSNLMATNPLFRPFNRHQRRDLLRRFTSHEVGAGADVIREGDVGRGLFVLLSGELSVSKSGAPDSVPLATLRPGDVFGEISLVKNEPTTATVSASQAATVLFLARETVEKMVAGVPAIRDYLTNLSADRELDTQLSLASGASPDSTILF